MSAKGSSRVMQTHPVIDRYLGSFAAAFDEFEASDRDEIVQELRNHIMEARASGTNLDSVLEALGPADALARAYAVELALNPRPADEVQRQTGVLAAMRAAGTRPIRAVAAAPGAVVTALRNHLRFVGRLVVRCLAWVRGRVGAGARMAGAGVVTAWGVVRRVSRLVGALATGALRHLAAVRRLIFRLVFRLARHGGRLARGAARGLITLAVTAPRVGWRAVARTPALGRSGLRRVWRAGAGLGWAAGVAGACAAVLAIGAAISVFGVGLILGGLFLLVTGVAELSGATWLAVPPSDVPPLVATTCGPILMAAGASVSLLVRFYARVVGAALPRAFAATWASTLARTLSRWADTGTTAPVASAASGYR